MRIIMRQSIDGMDAQLVQTAFPAPGDAPEIRKLRDLPDGFRNPLVGPVCDMTLLLFRLRIQRQLGQPRIIAAADADTQPRLCLDSVTQLNCGLTWISE